MTPKQGPFNLLELLLKSTHMLICKKHLHLESNSEFQKQTATHGQKNVIASGEKKNTTKKFQVFALVSELVRYKKLSTNPVFFFFFPPPHLWDHIHIVCVEELAHKT